MNPGVFYNKSVIDYSAFVFTTPNDFTTKASNKNTPKNKITVGELGTSITQDKYKPKMVTIVPNPQPIKILVTHFSENSAEMLAGMIKKANTVRMPPTCTE